MKFLNYVFVILFVSTGLYAQSIDVVLEKVGRQYSDAKPLSYTTTYNLYKNPKAVKIYQSYSGTFTKNGSNDIYVKIGDTEFYNTKKVNVTVSHKEKIIVVSAPGAALKEEYDIQKLLSFFTKSSLKDMKTYWEIELLAKPFSSLPYSKLVLTIGKDYYIKKQVFYYSTGTNFSDDYRKPDIDYPKLEITFGKPSTQAVPGTKFNVFQYFTAVGKTIKPTVKFANYELIDQR